MSIYHHFAPYASSFLMLDPYLRAGARTLADALLPLVKMFF